MLIRWNGSIRGPLPREKNLMKYIALLRGINVGTSVKVNMKDLKTWMVEAGFTSVSTYINSGNVIFESDEPRESCRLTIQALLKKNSGADIKTLVKTQGELEAIAQAIPDPWQNDGEQKTDVAFLFPGLDSRALEEQLPVKKDLVTFLPLEGTLVWNVRREVYNQSQLNKMVGHKLYQEMTVRNVNTVRELKRLIS